jgi:epoxyqueuosine reductase
MNIPDQIQQLINHECKELGFSHWGWTALETPPTIEFYKEWLRLGWHGEMDYLQEHLPQKENPHKYFPEIKSALVVAQPYVPHPRPQQVFQEAKVALYARGEDYHFWFKDKLKKLTQKIQSENPEDQFIVFTDSAPVLERDLAKRAGLGWIGKNTCLIDKTHGSLFLIGEIYSTLAIDQKIDISADHCGTCNRCIEACPTGAIESPRNLNATKCISYWTIEARTVPPEPLREKMQDWLFGCDICQTVCPWNEKAFRATPDHLKNKPVDREKLMSDLKEILNLSGKKLEKLIWGTPLQRAGPFGLRKNALIIIANQKLSPLKSDVQKWCEDSKLGELANWTLEKI